MRKAFFGVILFASFLITITVKATSTPEIIISEIMYNPAGADTGHQWIEIVNISTSTEYIIDDNWRFNDGSNHQLSIIQGDEVISPDEYIVIAENDAVFLQDYPDYQGSLIDTAMSLNNTEDSLSLSTSGGQTFFATTTYQADWGAADNGYTLERINLSDIWQQSYILGGTPGQENSLAPTNSPPVVEIIGQATGIVSQLIQFFASSTDPDGDGLSFLWNFGDRSTSSNQTVNHSYNQAGQYQVLLTASDGQLSATDTLRVIIEEMENDEKSEENGTVIEEDDEESINNNYSNQIIINEILPNPIGPDDEDEFIELYNRGNQPVNLNGWQLSDATTRRYAISSNYFNSTIIPAFGYFVVYRKDSGIALNNNGDSIELYQPNGQLLNTVTYFDSAENGWSYAKQGGSFIWTIEPTPGQLNVIKSEKEERCPAVDIVDQEVNESNNQIIPLTALGTGNKSNISYNADDFLGLRINEFMPNPIGSDSAEWIELFNNSTSTLNLNGFQLDDGEGGSRPYLFDASSTVSAFGYLIVNREQSKIALNNSQDSVRLIAPAGEIFSEIVYEKAKEGESYNFDEVDEEWFWSQSFTPGQKNITLSESIDAGQLEAALIEEVEFSYFSIAEIKELEKGVKVQAVGAVIVPPGFFGKQVMYISEPDLSSGIQLYSSSGEFPDLRIGDIIEVQGKVSEVQGEKRINLIKDSQINIIEHLTAEKPELTAIDELSDDLVGSLIYVSGELVEKKSSNYYLDDGTGEIAIYIKKTSGIKNPEVDEGYYMDVQGILTLTKSGYRLLPRFQDDINVGQILGESESVELSDEEIIVKADDQRGKIMKYLLFIGGGVVVVLISLIIKFKIKK